MFKDLQIQILEDVAETCIQVTDLSADSFIRFQLADNGRRIKRRRPEEMLEQLQEIIKQAPDRVWPIEELITHLGWVDSPGARRSVGIAVALLGNKLSTQRRYTLPADLPERVTAVVFDNCTSAELCERAGLPKTQGCLTKTGMTLKKLGWKRHKTLRPDGGVLWKWRKVV